MRNSHFTAASLVVITMSAIYQAVYIVPKQAQRFDHLDRKMDILYSRNGMHVRSKYEN